MIMGFPCNQFFGQEKRSNADIQEYVSSNFGVKFQMFEKVEVNGAECHPVYKFLRNNSSLTGTDLKIQEIPWNFAKFLVDRDGNVLDFFKPQVTPKTLIDSIEKMLID